MDIVRDVTLRYWNLKKEGEQETSPVTAYGVYME
jgi:hypothetical protein